MAQIRVQAFRPEANFSLGVESSRSRSLGPVEDLISPHWAGISTLAIAPGCCGVVGPVPSATLDKRCRIRQRDNDNKSGDRVKNGVRVSINGDKQHAIQAPQRTVPRQIQIDQPKLWGEGFDLRLPHSACYPHSVQKHDCVLVSTPKRSKLRTVAMRERILARRRTDLRKAAALRLPSGRATRTPKRADATPWELCPARALGDSPDSANRRGNRPPFALQRRTPHRRRL
jgi:hypothetical protein